MARTALALWGGSRGGPFGTYSGKTEAVPIGVIVLADITIAVPLLGTVTLTVPVLATVAVSVPAITSVSVET